MNIKIILVALLVGATFQAGFAQSPEEEVKQVIASLFDGMRSKNAQQVADAFSPEAQMQTVLAKPEGSSVGSNSVSDFVNRIASTPSETQLDERILDYQIKVDGTMASAWTPYEFYVNGSFSHCGVNSFQLVKFAEGWKIVYIIDTRRKEGC
ncbi:nuclear transport factor 2 family protein [Algoriphagus sp. CAU 1675]|uniref:nuclear transport factor 2 family protein n=1 Tax=Algoriphagus sp. CAU 1675 TaxID=3032597 RepID=UPI0023DC1DE0|nr:nuclear transport factor 2 family protein [Algoriphagus sp. CAU 1675]MDF2156907.1 nuclear transport factor 2 family protein [Algoriphagus sp. CAU 1675]